MQLLFLTWQVFYCKYLVVTHKLDDFNPIYISLRTTPKPWLLQSINEYLSSAFLCGILSSAINCSAFSTRYWLHKNNFRHGTSIFRGANQIAHSTGHKTNREILECLTRNATGVIYFTRRRREGWFSSSLFLSRGRTMTTLFPHLLLPSLFRILVCNTRKVINPPILH